MTRRLALLASAPLLLGGCGAVDEPDASPSPTPSAARSSTAAATPTPAEQATEDTTRDSGPTASDGRPRDASLRIERLGLRDVEVVAYRGRTDDARGTEIQNGGVAASPHGPEGGTGPGGIGNYQVTAHRLSAGGLFRELPRLRRGDEVSVRAGGTTYVYEIRRTRITSFREPQSLREQRAAVPGRPGVEADRAWLTLSTCRTIEDHAEGNYWSDEFDNPEHRIDKIGVLVRVERA